MLTERHASRAARKRVVIAQRVGIRRVIICDIPRSGIIAPFWSTREGEEGQGWDAEKTHGYLMKCGGTR